MSKRGRKFVFHGAYSRKSAAKKKEDSLPGAFILDRMIRGMRRFEVLTKRRK